MKKGKLEKLIVVKKENITDTHGKDVRLVSSQDVYGRIEEKRLADVTAEMLKKMKYCAWRGKIEFHKLQDKS